MAKEMSGLVGMFVGMLYMIGIGVLFPSRVDKVQVFQREDKPSVMRLYRPGRDWIYVADSNDSKNYISLGRYLNRIENKANRATELATIKKTVGWYD